MHFVQTAYMYTINKRMFCTFIVVVPLGKCKRKRISMKMVQSSSLWSSLALSRPNDNVWIVAFEALSQTLSHKERLKKTLNRNNQMKLLKINDISYQRIGFGCFKSKGFTLIRWWIIFRVFFAHSYIGIQEPLIRLHSHMWYGCVCVCVCVHDSSNSYVTDLYMLYARNTTSQRTKQSKTEAKRN